MPSEQITIKGQAYNVPLRYVEGHELTIGEASALNQTFHENIRNNLAKKAEEGSLTQEVVDQYAKDYAFGVRTGGGATRDPVMAEAMRIAKTKVTTALKSAGKKISEYETSAINDAAKALIDRDPQIMELARARVAQSQELATGDLGDLLAGLQTKPAEPTPAPEAAAAE